MRSKSVICCMGLVEDVIGCVVYITLCGDIVPDTVLYCMSGSVVYMVILCLSLCLCLCVFVSVSVSVSVFVSSSQYLSMSVSVSVSSSVSVSVLWGDVLVFVCIVVVGI